MFGGTILVVSYDRALLRTRAMLLRSEGYEVRMAENVTAAAEACRKASFDLVIIGHSIPSEDQVELSAIVRQECPGVPILVIIRSESEDAAGVFDYKVNAQDGPGVLLHTVHAVLRRGQKKQYA